MSETFVKFTLSHESDIFMNNFSGSVSPMLEIENVGKFFLTQAGQDGSYAHTRGLFSCIFRQLVSYDHLSKAAADSVHAPVIYTNVSRTDLQKILLSLNLKQYL